MHACPVCGGPGVLLGTLGRVDHYRCRDCGLGFSSEAETCEWFALCPNPADGTVSHPVLGDVPTCTRCADKLGLKLQLYTR